MKAKKIKRIREQCSWYLVMESDDLFGHFDTPHIYEERILAHDPKEAAVRFCKRHYQRDPGGYTTEEWAKYRVRPENKVNHIRHYSFFR